MTETRSRANTGSRAPADSIVYVVDDDASVRRGLRRLMRSYGLRVSVFESARRFLEAFRREQPSCAIVDVAMPGMGGLQLQATLGELAPELPIIFISGHHDFESRRRALDRGAVAFLAKPFDEEALVSVVRLALGGASS